jgi:acyl-CoA synthetase (AMP-forming)/AMP-acid ligase II
MSSMIGRDRRGLEPGAAPRRLCWTAVVNLATIIDPHPDAAVALLSRGKPTTYGDLRRQAEGLRGGLASLGLEPGDRVAIVAANNWYFVVSYLAVLGAGLVAVPLNPLSPAPEVEAELAAIGARAVIAGPTAKDVMGAIGRTALPDLEVVIASQLGEIAGAVPIDDLVAHALRRWWTARPTTSRS